MAREETWQETAAFWSHRALAGLAPVVPERAGHAAAAALGSLAYRCLTRRRADVTANQARVLGLDPGDERVRRATREAFALYARYWFDTFHLPALARDALDARVVVEGRHHIDAALARGRGCLVVLPHLGNWDVAGHLFAVHGYRLAAVAENLRPARLAALFRRHRERLGIRILALIDPKLVREEITRLLADNWIVCLLGDRALSTKGIAVTMFGAARPIPVGPALLARTTGAPLLVGAAHTLPAGWRITVTPPLALETQSDIRRDVDALAQRIAAELERAIAVHPADWHLFQPGWDAPLPRASTHRPAPDEARAFTAAAGRP